MTGTVTEERFKYWEYEYRVRNPYKFQKAAWPKVNLYDKQWDIVESCERDTRTTVGAANEMGKDFVGAFICIYKFCTRRPCRIVTSSAKDDHLDVLWTEMKNFLRTSAVALTADQQGPDGRYGPIIVKDRELLWEGPDGKRCELSYVKGMVSSDEAIASMGGHHIANKGDRVPRTFWLNDESSSMKDSYLDMVLPWAVRILLIGNTYQCSNQFYKDFKGDRGEDIQGGDLIRPYTPDQLNRFLRLHKSYSFPNDKPAPNGYDRRVMKLTVEDSPNVRYARAEVAAGKSPSDKMVVPGVKSWGKYQENLRTWKKDKISRSLYAEFPEGAAHKLFPQEWLDRAGMVAELLSLRNVRRAAKAIGVDPAEGGDKTAIAVVDELGLIHLEYDQTPNTAVIKHRVLQLIRKYDVDPENVLFDRGGGGKQITDQLREQGYDVRSISFGEKASTRIKFGKTMPEERVEVKEQQTAYKNMRAQMYGRLSELLDPQDRGNVTMDGGGSEGKRRQTWGIPRTYGDLFAELSPIPRLHDAEEVMYLPPKHKKNRDDKTVTLDELIGHSPDLADATVLAIHAMESEEEFVITAGL